MAARNAVVTGGTAGIGLAVARELRRRGNNVFVCGRDSDRLAKAIAELRSDGRGEAIDGAVCDVRDAASVDAAMTQARAALGRLDLLVNNAGVGFVRDFEEITPAMWSEILDTNLTGVFNCCRAILPDLKAAAADGVADIVNLGSRSGRYSFKGGVGYNTTKFGLQGLTEAMFLDLNRFGIRVSLVAPGTVATGFGGTAPAEWHLAPEDVALAVAAMVEAAPRACLNWIELRPARPPS